MSQLWANGQSLNTRWCQVEDLSSLVVPAGRRGSNITVPGRHGVVRTTNKRYDPTDVVIRLGVKGVDRTTGALVADGVTRLHENIDEVLRIFSGDTVELRYERDDGTARTAVTELTSEPVAVTVERSYPPLARVSVATTILGAFWLDADSVAQTITGPTGTEVELSEFAGGSAPISDLLITFFGPCNNPQLTVGDRWVKYNGVISSGRELQLNTATWQVSPGAGAAWSPDPRSVEFGRPPTWLELDPSVDPFVVTFAHTTGGSATVTIAGRRTHLVP